MSDPLHAHLVTGRFRDVSWVAETDSTNTRLLEAARQGAPDGTVLVADHQTAGRGRMDRRWEAPPGSSVLLSVLLRSEGSTAGELALFTMAAGVAMVEACAETAQVALRLKWPNDLLDPSGELKLGGMLSEVVWSGQGAGARPDAVVVGLGLNVNWPEELPPELRSSATSLRHLIGRDVDRLAVVGAFLRRLDWWLDRRDDRMVSAYRSHLSTLGRRVRVETADGVIEGVAVDLTATGMLRLDSGSGEHIVAAGDVVHLRPA